MSNCEGRVIKHLNGRWSGQINLSSDKGISTTLEIYTRVTSAVMKEAADGADEAMQGMV